MAKSFCFCMTCPKIEKFTVISHDWGTFIGSVLVGDHPERILGFVRTEADLVYQHHLSGADVNPFQIN
jgi:pimeloyl-ACP methyl ester carboxylesterase